MDQNLEVFADYKDAINQAIPVAFQALPPLLRDDLSTASRGALEKLQEYSSRPGKRLRGSLAAIAYDQANGTRLAEAGIQLGVALEFMQNYLLIVDDVMDKSAERRGEPTIHELYQVHGAMDLHEAQMMAVNVGELAQHIACLVVAAIDVPAEPVRQTMALLHRNIAATGLGQIDDLQQQVGRTASADDIIRKYQLKSSYYTFINPLQCGFALAGKVDQPTLVACKQFGLPAGVAFQLHDDYLGIFADSKTLGKPNLDDIREGKNTLLMHQALQQANSHDKTMLRSILGKADANEVDLDTVRAILNRSGAAAFVQAETLRYATVARAELSKNSWQPGLRDILSKLVAFSIERKR